MSRGKKLGNLAGIAVPFAGLLASPILIKKRKASVADFVIAAGFYLATGFGVTVGYHRLLTHRAFKTSKPVKYTFAVLGAMALEGPPVGWVADHRKHHAFTDEVGDPHSPWVEYGPGWRQRVKGFFHAHMGWLFSSQGAIAERYARDLYEDPGMQLIGRLYPVIIVASLGLPAVVGWRVHGGKSGALRGFIWGGLVRECILLHSTFLINSACHFLGGRRFNTKDHSTNVRWLALPTLGEAWHNNHHEFPTSAEHGMGPDEFDPSATLIRLLEKSGLVWDVVRIPPEKQQAKEVASA
jgi:stearoyl-CoA desaturase (delta-9 desaturase)